MNKIFIVNIGSTSLKFYLFNMDQEQMLIKGYLERIGNADSPMGYNILDQDVIKIKVDTSSGYGVGLKAVLDIVMDAGLLKDFSELSGIGFKAVHAGDLTESTLVTDKIIAQMENRHYLSSLDSP